MKSLYKFIIFSLFLIVFQVSCDGSGKEPRALGKLDIIDGKSLGYEESIDLNLLQDDLNALELAITLNQVLQKNPERSKVQIVSAIENARIGMLSLAEHGADNKDKLNDVFSVFTVAISQYDTFGILDFEQSRFDRVFNKVKFLRFLIGKKLELPDDYTWVLYNHNFADGIEPYFNLFSGRSVNWVTNFQIDIPKAKAAGFSSHSWMVSRPFSLKGIKTPSFTYFTQFTVVAPDQSNEDLASVVEKVFQTYIILDLKPGENPDRIDESRKIRVDYEIKDYPLARNFHDDWMPKVSLEEYRGHDVSIAFVFDTRKIRQTSYYLWDIFDFEIHGAGLFKEPSAVYVPNFEEDLGGYQAASLSFGGEEWKNFNKGVSITSGTSADTDAFLLSPKYVAPPGVTSLRLFVSDSFEGDAFQTADLLISTNFHGGVDPSDPSILWKKLNVEDKDLDSENYKRKDRVYNISDYIGENFVLAMRFKSKVNTEFSWKVHKVYLETTGDKLALINYTIPYLLAENRIAFYELATNAARKYERIYADDDSSPKWRKSGNTLSISAHNGKKPPSLGPSRLIFPETDLQGILTPRIRIAHSMRFLNKPEALNVQIRNSCIEAVDPCEHFWENLVFPEGTFQRFVDQVTTSSWIDVPDKYKDKKIEISLFYQGSEGNTPEWKVQFVEFGGVK